jgi:hypothetical protein
MKSFNFDSIEKKEFIHYKYILIHDVQIFSGKLKKCREVAKSNVNINQNKQFIRWLLRKPSEKGN